MLAQIEEDKDGCEISNFKCGEREDILVTDYSSVKRKKLSFTKSPSVATVYSSIADINNEFEIFQIINTKGYLYNLGEEKETEKDGKKLRLIQGSLKDNTDNIAITLFGESIDKVDEKMSYVNSGL